MRCHAIHSKCTTSQRAQHAHLLHYMQNSQNCHMKQDRTTTNTFKLYIELYDCPSQLIIPSYTTNGYSDHPFHPYTHVLYPLVPCHADFDDIVYRCKATWPSVLHMKISPDFPGHSRCTMQCPLCTRVAIVMDNPFPIALSEGLRLSHCHASVYWHWFHRQVDS